MNILTADQTHIPRLQELLLQVELVHHAIRPDIFRNGARKYDEAALKTLLQDPAKPVFVALVDGQVQGYCFCQLKDVENSVMNPRRELYIDDLCVEERCRGQGIAAALYRHAHAFAQAQHCGYITLNVWCGNDALQFYEHMGLRPRNMMMETVLEEEHAD